MSEKIVQRNEEVIKEGNQGTGSRQCGRNAQRAARGRGGETYLGCPI